MCALIVLSDRMRLRCIIPSVSNFLLDPTLDYNLYTPLTIVAGVAGLQYSISKAATAFLIRITIIHKHIVPPA